MKRTCVPRYLVLLSIVVFCLVTLGETLAIIHYNPVPTSIPPQEVYVLCQPGPHETSVQYAACVSEVSQAWKMAQR